MDVSIIIVNYNTRDLLKDCLISIYKHTTEIDFEVIVSDNGSVDGSIEMLKKEFPQVVLIENNANLGFGTANNRGLVVAKGKYIFYLNSDTILLNNAVKLFYDYWENSPEKEMIGALGCNLLDGEGKYNNKYADKLKTLDIKRYVFDMLHVIYGVTKISFLNFFLNKPYPILQKVENIEYRVGEVGHIIGACLFLLNNKFAKFDENYFMYDEETDLEYRLVQLGKKLLLIPGPNVIHFDGGSSRKAVNMMEYYSSFSYIHKTLSEIYYYSKHGENVLRIFLMKFLIFLLWSHPVLVKKNKKYLIKLLLA